ncbi:MAG: acryloyl-CoA reductase [Bdellovibrionales bacterium]
MRNRKLLVHAEPRHHLEVIDSSDGVLESGCSKIKVSYSSLNYKDALAITGKARILKSFPMVPGIDAMGEIIETGSAYFEYGQKVLITGCNLGESYDGGLQSIAMVPDEALIPIPSNLSDLQCAFLGTAGFTAMLAVIRMNQNTILKSDLPILVSGASGGVGSIACYILSSLGHEVHAISSRVDQTRERLMSLGCTKVLSLDSFLKPPKALEKAQYSNYIDNIGGAALESILPKLDLYGNAMSIGLALGSDFKTTVMPHILRGVSILGVSSNNCPRELRDRVWRELAQLPVGELMELVSYNIIGLNDCERVSEEIISGNHVGRSIVKLSDD